MSVPLKNIIDIKTNGVSGSYEGFIWTLWYEPDGWHAVIPMLRLKIGPYDTSGEARRAATDRIDRSKL